MIEVAREDIRRIVALQLGRATVRDDDRIVDDLGADSFDVLNLVTLLEERFGIAIADEELPEVETVADLYEIVKKRLAP